MRPRTQKQPQVKKELCRVLDDVDVDENNIEYVLLIFLHTQFWYTKFTKSLLPVLTNND